MRQKVEELKSKRKDSTNNLIKMQRAKAYAKINLYLDTLCKGAKFTKIRTIFAQIDLYDTLSAQTNRSGKINFGCSHANLQSSDNLVVKVAQYLKSRYKVDKGADIYLHKQIPVAAGLGGGSSDAATTLLMLDKEWDLGLSTRQLDEAAALFGSDINFFLRGGVCLGQDRGQEVSKLALEGIDNILLVNPQVAISSKEAYHNVKSYGKTKGFEKFIASADVNYCYNGLQAGVEELYPIVGECLQGLLAQGAQNAILSGSGATVIGFFKDPTSLTKAENYFKDKKFWTLITKTGRSVI